MRTLGLNRPVVVSLCVRNVTWSSDVTHHSILRGSCSLVCWMSDSTGATQGRLVSLTDSLLWRHQLVRSVQRRPTILLYLSSIYTNLKTGLPSGVGWLLTGLVDSISVGLLRRHLLVAAAAQHEMLNVQRTDIRQNDASRRDGCSDWKQRSTGGRLAAASGMIDHLAVCVLLMMFRLVDIKMLH